MQTDESKAKKLMLLDEMFQEQPSLLLVKKFVEELDIEGEDGEKGEKGDKGDTGERGEKGDDGAPGKDGKDGTNGRDGRDGRDGADGEDGKDGSPDSPDEVIAKINASSEKIQRDRVDGLDDEIKRIEKVASQPRGAAPGYSLTIQDDGITIDKNTRYINFTGGNISRSASGVVTVPMGGGSGWTIETPTGSLYDQDTASGGTSFTSSDTAVAVFADGATYFNGCGCIISGTSITMDNPVTQFIRVAI